MVPPPAAAPAARAPGACARCGSRYVPNAKFCPECGLRRPVTECTSYGGGVADGVGAGKGKGKSASMRIANGDFAHYGYVREFDAARTRGLISCGTIHAMYGQEVYIHQQVLESAGAGVGDTVVFFLHWSRNGQIQASTPVLRIDAGSNGHALKGTVKAASSTGFGFIDCPQVREFFGKDVFVNRDIAEKLIPGSCVSFNVQLTEEAVPNATEVLACDPSWEPTPADLSQSDAHCSAPRLASPVHASAGSAAPRPALQGRDAGEGLEQGVARSHADELDLRPTGKTLTGWLKSLSEANGWGYLHSDEAEKMWNADVFVLKCQLRSTTQVGDQFRFDVGVNAKGQLQAMNVLCLQATDPRGITMSAMGPPKRQKIDLQVVAMKANDQVQATSVEIAPIANNSAINSQSMCF